MKIGVQLLATAAFGALALQAAPAAAQTLNITYYSVAHGTDADFPGGNPTVAAGSALGANGLPVGTGVADLAAGNQITWWSPTLNSHVVQTGTGVITLPYGSNMFAPNSTGTNNTNFFETAVLSGNLSLATNSTVQFSLGSDDDSFIYIDGTLFGQNPGIHGTTNVTFTTPTLTAGNHFLQVFYADRQNTQAYLSLSLLTQGVTVNGAVPEPATWAMMIAGFGLVGGAMRRRKTAVAFA